MEDFARSDLACEQKDIANATSSEEQVRQVGFVTVRSVTAEPKNAGSGRYITLECGNLAKTEEDEELLCRVIAGELAGLAKRLTGKGAGDLSVFVAGLGNASLTADAIGPETVARLTVTRHLREYEPHLYQDLACSAISALAPGVLGQTGIETLEILRGTVRAVKPDLVIVIDALAARSCSRLASTIQISDTGITPGSGVGNHRMGIDRETLGVPVIALGVPTVVDSATLVWDALQEAGIGEISDSLRKVLEQGRSFFVSPKESDRLTRRVAEILSRSIGLAFADKLFDGAMS